MPINCHFTKKPLISSCEHALSNESEKPGTLAWGFERSTSPHIDRNNVSLGHSLLLFLSDKNVQKRLSFKNWTNFLQR